MTNDIVRVGDTYEVPACTFTVQDKTFIGWNDFADGTGTEIAAAVEITITDDIILYAQ